MGMTIRPIFVVVLGTVLCHVRLCWYHRIQLGLSSGRLLLHTRPVPSRGEPDPDRDRPHGECSTGAPCHCTHDDPCQFDGADVRDLWAVGLPAGADHDDTWRLVQH